MKKQRFTLGELSEQLRVLLLHEDLTFGQLFQLTDPARLARAKNYVRGPPLEIYGDSKNEYHVFNFKSYPSTTGLRHRGYVAFKRPLNGQPQTSENIAVEVDCDCPDYRYRWAWANKQHGAGSVGAGSMNKAHNRAPVVTNPSGKPSLCKHIAATVDYVGGLIHRFRGGDGEPGTDVDVSWKIEQLVKWSQKRHDNYDAEVEKAKQRAALYKQAQAARNVAGPMPAAEVPQGTEDEMPVPLPPDEVRKGDKDEPEEGEIQTRTESRVVKLNSKLMSTEKLTETEVLLKEMGDELGGELGHPGDAGNPEASADELAPEDIDLDIDLDTAEGEPEDEALGLLRDISAGIGRLADELAPVEDEADPEALEEPEAPEDDSGVPPVEDDDEFTDAMPVSTGA